MSSDPAVVSRPARRAGRDPRAVWRELRILLRFRLSAGGRDPRRTVAGIVVLVLGLGVVLPVVAALVSDQGWRDRAAILAPWIWAAFVVASALGALASSGGRELLPRREGSTFPVSCTTDQLGALVLVPLNVAWTLQAITLLGVTAYAVGPSWWLPVVLASCWAWILAATAVAQLLGWAAELVRTYRHGTLALRALVVAFAALVAMLAGGAEADDLVTRSLPALSAVLRLASAPVALGLTVLALAGTAVLAVIASVPLVERLQLRPSLKEADRETRRVRRRRSSVAELTNAVVTDVLSVVRSAPLRRGLTVLLATPVAIAMLIPLPWLGISVLPALVCSATALLHGVNAVALDGRGAVWRESLPQRPNVTLVGRVTALTLLCGGSSAVVVTVAGSRTDPPDATEVFVVIGCVVVATAQVVSRCALWSVRHPYPADLRRGRDTPAPPGAMAGYSVRLSVATTGAAVLLGVGLAMDSPRLTAGVALALLLVSALRLRTAFQEHANVTVRSRVAAVVSGA